MASGFNVAINIQTTGAPAAAGQLGKVGSSAAQAQVKVTGLTGSFKALAGAMAALPIAFLVREIAQAVQQFDSINDSLTTATGSSKGAARELGFVREEARRLGLDLGETARSYGKYLAAANLSGASTRLARQGFTAMSEATQALGLDQEALATGLNGVTKMMAENKVSARQLSGLFGNEFKGAFAIAAQSLGVTSDELQKMITKGEITADQLLPRMFEWMHKTFGPEAAKNAEQLEGQINRLHNAFAELSLKGGGGMAQSLGLVNDALEFLINNFGHVRAGFAIVQEMVVRGAKLMADAILTVARGWVAMAEKAGSVLKFFGKENPFEGWTAAIEKTQGDIDKFLDNLADGFNEVAVEQFAGDMEHKVAPAVDEVNKRLGKSSELADLLAKAAERAHAAFKGMAPAELAGEFNRPFEMDPAAMDALLDMAQKLKAEMGGIADVTEPIGIDMARFREDIGIIVPRSEILRQEFEKLRDANALNADEIERAERAIALMKIDELAAKWISAAEQIGEALSLAFGKAGKKIDALIHQAIDLYGVFRQILAAQNMSQAGVGGLSAGAGIAGLGASFGLTNPAHNYSAEGGALGGAAGGIAGFAVGSALGFGVGGPIGAAFGTLIGGVLGTAIGSMIKKGSEEALATIKISAESGEISAIIDKAQGDLGTAIAQINKAITDSIGEALSALGGTGFAGSESFGGFSIKIRDGIVSVFINGITQRFEQVDEAIAFAVDEFFKSATMLGVPEEIANAVKLAAQQAGTNMTAFNADLGFIQQYNNLGKTPEQVQLEQLDRWFKEAAATAERLGLDVSRVNEEYERQRQVILDTAAAEQKRVDEERKQAEEELRRAEEERHREHQAHVQAQRDINEQIRLLQMSAGGASSGLVDLNRQLYDLDKQLAEQAAAGLHGTGQLRNLTLQSWLADALAPVNEILNPLDAAGQVHQRFDDIREQVEFIADQLGVAVEPMLALIDAAEQSELTRITNEAVEAENRLADARRSALEGLQDLTAPDFVKRIRDIETQVNAALGSTGFTFANRGGLASSFIPPEVLNAGQAAVQALGRDFLQSLQQMGIEIPGLTRAIAEYNKAMFLTNVAALAAAGAFDGLDIDIADIIAQGTAYWDAVANGTATATTAVQDFTESVLQAQQAAGESFKNAYDALFGTGLIDDPVARIHAQVADLKSQFLHDVSFEDKQKFFDQFGIHIDPTTKLSELGDLFDQVIGPKEAELIAKAIADALKPITDYFADLRHSGAGLSQTQRFSNVFADFQAAIAGHDMEDAVALARLLTGDVGVGQFGSSSQAFKNLRDFIVGALSSTFGVTAPDLGQSQQQYQSQALGLYNRTASAAEQSVQIQRDGFADMLRKLDDIGRRAEAGALAGRR